MSSYIPDYDISTPKNLNDALELLYRKQLTPIAGGTDIMVLLEAGRLDSKSYLNIQDLDDLKGFSDEKDYFFLGSLSTFTDIKRNSFVRKYFPLLVQAANQTASIPIQNRATIGGNVANSSPAADTPPVLLSYNAQIELISKYGSRIIPFNEFYTGYKSSIIEPEELIKGFRIPKKKYGFHFFRKVASRKSQAISKVVISLTGNYDNVFKDFNLAFGSVGPTPIFCEKIQKFILGNRITKNLIKSSLIELSNEISPISDIRSTKLYRLNVSKNLLADFLEEIKLCGTG